MKNQQTRYGFDEVITPLIYKTDLWRRLGHHQNYQDDMFKVMGNDMSRDSDLEEDGSLYEYGLKPMNCPGHCVMFSKIERSYNELPIRYSDFSALHRNEASGSLSGLNRVRCFHQDDGHIFCEFGQIEQEVETTLKLIKEVYGVFGISGDDIEFYISTRPLEKYMGDLETWNAAEAQLCLVLDSVCGPSNWKVRPGEGAFYGPKIDVLLTDAYKKSHQVGTVQLDFHLPNRFQLRYTGRDGDKNHHPIMVHRAVFGSLERFISILLDHYQGKWPFWINPRQAMIIPVNDSHLLAAQHVSCVLQGDIVEGQQELAPLTGHHFYVDVDSRSETVSSRIKGAIQKGYSYIVVVGEKEIANGTITVRTRDDGRVSQMTARDLYGEFMLLDKQFK